MLCFICLVDICLIKVVLGFLIMVGVGCFVIMFRSFLIVLLVIEFRCRFNVVMGGLFLCVRLLL